MASQEQITETEKVVSPYRPSSYAEATWPTIEVPVPQESKEFAPAEFEQISESSFAVDPMFADFGAEESGDIAENELARPRTDEDQDDQDDHDDQAETGVDDEMNAEPGEVVSQDALHDGKVEDGEESISKEEVDEIAASPADVDDVQQSEEPTVPTDSAAHEAALIQAREEGYARGCAETRADSELHQRQLEERYALLWEDMQTQLTESVLAHEQQAIELAFQIARRMVGAVVDSQREYVVSVVKEALHAAGSSEVKVIRVSPQDHEFLQLGGYGDRIKIHGDKKLMFESDESIRSGCIVVTNAGEIDFDLDKAWARMHEKALQGPRT